MPSLSTRSYVTAAAFGVALSVAVWLLRGPSPEPPDTGATDAGGAEVAEPFDAFDGRAAEPDAATPPASNNTAATPEPGEATPPPSGVTSPPAPPPARPTAPASPDAGTAPDREERRALPPPAEVPDETHASGLPWRDVFADPDLAQQIGRSIPDLAECHRLLMELDDTVPSELAMRFEATVVPDPDAPDRGRVELQYVNAPDLAIDDIACFAEVFDGIEIEAPDDDGYAFRAEASTRVETSAAPPSER